MKVTFFSQDGGNFNDPIVLAEGSTVGQLLRLKMGNSFSPDSYRITVNRSPVSSHQIDTYRLGDGDKIAVTPNKIAGAF